MLETLLFQPQASIFPTLVIGVLGLLVGSFLNVVIYRMPKMIQRRFENDMALENGREPPHTDRFNLIVPRSACPHCGRQITALENIPLISYIFLGGKCRGCSAGISIRYPLVEFFTGALSAFLIWRFGSGWMGLSSVLFAWFLISLTGIDLDTQLLPDDLTLLLLWVGLFVNIKSVFVPLNQAVIGAMVGYLSLWSIYWLFKIMTGKEGMGYGDFKLLAALGAWLGWKLVPAIILLSTLVGAIVGIALIVFTKHGRETPIPFGPYLAAAGLIALLFRQPIEQFMSTFL